MEDFTLREYFPTKIIFKEGSVGDTAYILKKGRVRISTKVDGATVDLAELTPVTIFGEMALLSNEQRRTATAEAVEHSEVIEIHKKRFDELLSKTPSVIVTVLRAVARRLADTNSKIRPDQPEEPPAEDGGDKYPGS